MSWSLESVDRSFFRQPGLAQAVDNDRWWLASFSAEPFDRELRIETTRLRQSEFRLGVVPLRGLSSGQNGVGNIGPVSCVNCSLKFLDRRVKPTPANLGKAQVRVPDAAEGIAGA